MIFDNFDVHQTSTFLRDASWPDLEIWPQWQKNVSEPIPMAIISVKIGREQPLNKTVTKGTKKGKNKNMQKQPVKEKNVNHEGTAICNVSNCYCFI